MNVVKFNFFYDEIVGCHAVVGMLPSSLILFRRSGIAMCHAGSCCTALIFPLLEVGRSVPLELPKPLFHAGSGCFALASFFPLGRPCCVVEVIDFAVIMRAVAAPPLPPLFP